MGRGRFAHQKYPLGSFSDRVSHKFLLIGGLALLIVADQIPAAPLIGPWFLPEWRSGAFTWARRKAFLAVMVADNAPADLRGTTYGFFNLVSGVALLIASIVAGLLWDSLGAPATFLTGAAFSVAALVLLIKHGGNLPIARGALCCKAADN